MKKYLVIIFLCMLQGAFAQVMLRAVPSCTKIGVNEKLKVKFIINDDDDNFIPPSFQGFQVSGPGINISTEGLVTVKTYIYVLTPTQTGSFTIGQASVVIGEKIYKSAPFTIEVVTAVTDPNISAISQKTSKDQNEQQVEKHVKELEETGVIAVAGETNIVLGQAFTLQLIATDKSAIIKEPSLNDFNIIDQEESSIDGSVSTFYKKTYTLIPKYIGMLTIGSAQIDVKGKIHETKPIHISVANNAINNFADKIIVKAKLSKDIALTNEPVVLQYFFMYPEKYAGILNEVHLSSELPYKNNIVYKSDLSTTIDTLYNGERYVKKGWFNLIIKFKNPEKIEIPPFELLVNFDKERVKGAATIKDSVKVYSDPVGLTILKGKFEQRVNVPKIAIIANRKLLKLGQTTDVDVIFAIDGYFDEQKMPEILFSGGLKTIPGKVVIKRHINSFLEIKTILSQTFAVTAIKKGNQTIASKEFGFLDYQTRKKEILKSKQVVIETE